MTQETPSRSVLIVDDSATGRAAISLALLQAGFDAIECTQYFELPKLVDQHNPFLIILELNMPVIDGEQIASFLGRNSYTGEIIVYSNAEQRRIDQAVASIGAFEGLKKAGDYTDLSEAVQRAWASRERTPEETSDQCVLLVDDDPEQFPLVQKTLSSIGISRVIHESTAWISIVIRREKPTLILMDIDLGGIRSGAEAVASMKKLTTTKGPPVVLYSALGRNDLAKLADDCGADGYVCKSDGPRALIAEVTRVLNF